MADSLRLLVFSSILASVLPIGFEATVASAADSVAVVASFNGRVLIRHPGKEGAPDDIVVPAVNQPLALGDTVQTGDTGSAKILFKDDSIVDLGPRASFKIDLFKGGVDAERSGVLSLLYGRLRALVSKAATPASSFEVKTHDAVMGVRGTEFIVTATPSGVDRGRTNLTVVEGNVGLSLPKGAGPPLSVTAGMTATAINGMTELPKAVQLPPQTAQAYAQQARVPDNTFTRTVSLDSGTHNDLAPQGSTGVALAFSNTAMAAAQANTANPSNAPITSVGTFNILNTISVPPVSLLPGNLQTVNVILR